MTLEEKARHVRELRSHPGWHLFLEQLAKELEGHLSNWLENRPVSQQEADYRRGVISLGRRIPHVPDILTNQFEFEAAKESAANPAKAGKETT